MASSSASGNSGVIKFRKGEAIVAKIEAFICFAILARASFGRDREVRASGVRMTATEITR